MSIVGESDGDNLEPMVDADEPQVVLSARFAITMISFGALVALSLLPWMSDAQAQQIAAQSGGANGTSLEGGRAGAQQSPRRLLPLPAEEDWSFLADPAKRTDPFDGFKYVPTGPNGSYVSFGGEARSYYESYRNEGFGQYPGTSSYLEQRLLFHTDAHLAPGWRVFLEFQSESIGGRPGGPRPTVDKDRADLLEGFVEWSSAGFDPILKGPDLTFRVGRQELDFGAGRLVSAREGLIGEGPNVLQGFDGVRGIWRNGPWRLDLFAALPVENKIGAFDDAPFPHQAAWGAYLTHGGPPGAPVPGFDFYYLGTERPDAAFYSGSGYERRHTLGARAFQTSLPYDYDVEAFYQFGTNGSRDIQAWSLAAEGGYTFQGLPWSPRTGLRFGLNSGGGDASILRDVYAPFPRGAYFGVLSAVGPENLDGVEALLSVHPTDTVTLKANVFFFWRNDTHDGLYSLAGYPLVAPTNGARYVGYQPGVSASWQLTPHLALNAAYETLQRGDFLKTAPGTAPINYFSVWTTFRF